MPKDDKKKAKKGAADDKKKSKKDAGEGKEKKEKKEKKGSAGADAAAASPAPAPASGAAAPLDATNLMAKYDAGGKGYLTAAEVQRMVAEVGTGGMSASGASGPGATGYAPRVGPFAGNTMGQAGAQAYGYGAGLYGALASRGLPMNGARTLGLPSSPFGNTAGGGGPAAYGPAATGRLLQPSLNGLPGAVPPPPPPPDTSAIALAQAYQTRMAALSSVAASLLAKREGIAHQLAKVQTRMSEVSSARDAIEAETFADTEAILHRLRASEASKLAVLQHDADVLVGDVAAIDAFYSALTSYQPNVASGAASLLGAAASAAGPGGAPGGAADALSGLYDPHVALDFMRAYPELCAEADRLVGKAVKGDIDVRADDFERETAARIDLASKYSALVDLVAAKDRIILQLIKERESVMRDREASRSTMENALERAAADRELAERERASEAENWARVADRLSSQLNDVTEKLLASRSGSAAVPLHSAVQPLPMDGYYGSGNGGNAGYRGPAPAAAPANKVSGSAFTSRRSGGPTLTASSAAAAPSAGHSRAVLSVRGGAADNNGYAADGTLSSYLQSAAATQHLAASSAARRTSAGLSHRGVAGVPAASSAESGPLPLPVLQLQPSPQYAEGVAATPPPHLPASTSAAAAAAVAHPGEGDGTVDLSAVRGTGSGALSASASKAGSVPATPSRVVDGGSVAADGGASASGGVVALPMSVPSPAAAAAAAPPLVAVN